MTRLIRLTMTNVRNVNHGRITFHTLPIGGCVTGIYGQNGSGKTTAIDAISILQTLMSGHSLDYETQETINPDRQPLELEATFHINDEYLSYHVTIGLDDGTPMILEEEIKTGSTEKRLGRPIISWHPSDDLTLNVKPGYLWDTLADHRRLEQRLMFANRDGRLQHRSFVFSRELTQGFDHDLETVRRRLPSRAGEALDSHPNLFSLLAELRRYAERDIAILTTGRGGQVALHRLPIAVDDLQEGGYDDRLYEVMRETITLPPENARRLHAQIDTFNIILPAIIPGLTLELADRGEDDLDDGSTGIRVSLRSRRGNATIPFRKESEGVQRIVSMLTFLIHAYNDPDALIAIDELDTGIYEHLLGVLIREFALNARGQLVFTAHNLRIMETVPQPSRIVVLTTTDPNRRFMPFRHVATTGNGRNRYLTAIDRNLGPVILYEKPSEAQIREALLIAGQSFGFASASDPKA
ncbi:AAA family ATPase [Bifidobacterium sp. SO1]|uniref:AAA family ATPase n=1 Tax=Bifidobacterium sp. SO1 TaxID=2809029 RepID=UPI001BDC31AA|nr:AAA family ATPase [Bifidobacterium sp. SO1]MBT1162092.1 AAA family ATPase [Bifidobacterium sp. SO1]